MLKEVARQQRLVKPVPGFRRVYAEVEAVGCVEPDGSFPDGFRAAGLRYLGVHLHPDIEVAVDAGVSVWRWERDGDRWLIRPQHVSQLPATAQGLERLRLLFGEARPGADLVNLARRIAVPCPVCGVVPEIVTGPFTRGLFPASTYAHRADCGLSGVA